MKHLKQFMLAVLVALASSATASAYDFEVDGVYFNYNSRTDLTCEITYQMYRGNGYYSPYSGDFVIPEHVVYSGRTYTVTGIGQYAFRYAEVTSVSIPSRVTGISENAFFHCENLSSIVIPDNVTTIGNDAFNGCYNLSAITLGNNIETIGEYAFCSCGMYAVSIPEKVKTIEYGAFRQCKNLTTVVFPENLETIGVAAFYQCVNLLTITIPDNVTSIATSAFSGCSNISSIVLGRNVETIGASAFSGCGSLEEIISLNNTPPHKANTSDQNHFNGVSTTDCVVKVPEETVDAYKAADLWKSFKNIEVYTGEIKFDLYDGNETVFKCTGNTLYGAVSILGGASSANAMLFRNVVMDDVPDVPVANFAIKNIYNMYAAKEIVLSDAAPFYSPYNVAADNLTYTRTFNTTNWQPLYIPFNMSYEEWSEFADVAEIRGIYAYDDSEGVEHTVLAFHKLTSGELKPNTPYVIKPKETGEVTFSCTNKTLMAAESGSVWCASTRKKYTLTGIYKTKMNMAGVYAMSSGAFYLGDASSPALSPFRFYLTVEDIDNGYGTGSVANAPARIQIVIDGEATSIDEIVVGSKQTDSYYDMSGRRVAQPTKGIYVRNGKKVIIK